tara:strand:- start:249 stop:617 length:369 start_codon:yes stop_codon:yes gene_type:complete
MSHIVIIETQVRDPDALRLACRRNALEAPVFGTTKLFNAEVTGYLVSLPRWRYPVACNTNTGEVLFDNYGGSWGEQAHLDRLMQSYAIEKSVMEARKQGHSVTEQLLADGSIKLTVQVGGAS